MPGENILAIVGPIIDFAETKRRGPQECMAIQIGPDRYIDTQPPGVFVNHSCEPNAGIRQNQNLVALRKIRRGQEIRYDYSTTMEEDSFAMQCLCGAPSVSRMGPGFLHPAPAAPETLPCPGHRDGFHPENAAGRTSILPADSTRSSDWLMDVTGQ
jgi:hypothetical protein